jgi:hypothetical protein
MPPIIDALKERPGNNPFTTEPCRLRFLSGVTAFNL